MRAAAAMLGILALAAAARAANPPNPGPPGDPVAAGRRLFGDPSLSGGGRIACSTCHPDGRTDNRTYIGVKAVPDGTADGRNTPTLVGSRDTGPYTWGGNASLETTIRTFIVDRMKGKEPAASQIEALAAYIRSLKFPANALVNADGTPSAAASEAARRGHKAFVKAGCDICHQPPVFATGDDADIGSGGTFNIPSLRGVAGTAPYFHDGRLPTLRALVPAKLALLKELGLAGDMSDKEIEDLIAFLEIL